MIPAQELSEAAGYTLVNKGTIQINPGGGPASSITGSYNNQGTFNLAGATLSLSGGVTGLVNEPGGLINAWGTINISGSSLTNNGTLSVNTTDASTLTINGTYTQSSTGALNIQLGGSDPALSDLLNVNGLANLAGSMNISLINGFKPVQGDSFKVVTFPGASGSISTYNGLDLSSANIALQPFQNPVNITLTTQTLVSTTVGVTSSGNPSPYGTPVTFTATVAPAYTGLPTPTGSVQFLNGGTPLGSPVLLVAGVATTPALTTLGVGTDTITAKYLGDTNFGLNAGSTTQTISRGTATVTLSANNSSPTYGQVLYFVATVATPFVGGASPTGSAQFQVDGKNFGAPVTLGKGPVASMSTTTLAAGPHTVTVVYTGDSTYGGSSASLGVPVTPGATSRFAVAPPAPSNVAAGAQFAITFEAEDKGGNLTPGYTGTVALTSNDPSASLAPVNYTFTSSDAGTHTFYVTLNATGTQTLNLADKADGISLTVPVTVTAVTGDRRAGKVYPINIHGGGTTFAKPSDNIGTKTIPNYAAYASQFIYNIDIPIPGCTTQGRVFVGQRKDPFAVNLGVIFDLLNVPGVADFSAGEANFLLDPSMKDAGTDSLMDKNVTSLALEVPTSCLVAGGDAVIGGWTTASLRQGSLLSSAPKSGYQTSAIVGGAWTQVSRLGSPLVNEVVIGLPDKDKFNNSKPKDDAQFATYVTNPTLPALIEIALAHPGIAPTNFPRTDLVTTFLTGIPGVTQPKAFTASPATGVASEMLRLNTGIPPTPYATQNRLGLLGGLLGPAPQDLAGYPNGRRPNDDVVDISLVAMMGGLCVANGTANSLGFGAACMPSVAPLGTAAYGLHDGVDQAGPKVKAAGPLLPGFPYIGTPLPGAQ